VAVLLIKCTTLRGQIKGAASAIIVYGAAADHNECNNYIDIALAVWFSVQHYVHYAS